jgi:hypothetical protein
MLSFLKSLPLFLPFCNVAVAIGGENSGLLTTVIGTDMTEADALRVVGRALDKVRMKSRDTTAYEMDTASIDKSWIDATLYGGGE